VVTLAGRSFVPAGGQWICVQSKNFRALGNINENELKRITVKLEQFHIVLAAIFKDIKLAPPKPITVIVFSEESEFTPFKPVAGGKRKDWVAGFFQPGADTDYIVLSNKLDGESTERVAFHEYTHFLIHNVYGQVPAWLNEGLAEYFERFVIDESGKSILGQPNPTHLKTLQNNSLIPFKHFLNIDYSVLNEPSSEKVKLFYAQSWGLVHFLMHGNGGKRKPSLIGLIESKVNNDAPADRFEVAFDAGKEDLEYELRSYLSKQNFPTAIIAPDEIVGVSKDFKIRAISFAEAQSHFGDLLYRMNRVTDAEKILEQSMLAEPDLIKSNITLGLVKLSRGDIFAAASFLEKAIATDPDNYLTHFNFAFVLSRQGVTGNGVVAGYTEENALKIKKSLRRVILLEPTFAEAYHLYAFVCIVQNEDLDDAAAMLAKAIEISPGNALFELRMAEIFSRKKQFDKALEIAGKVIKQTNEPELQSLARSTLQKINDYQKMVEEVRQRNLTSNPYVIDTDKPLTASELEELNRKIANDSINSNLRRPGPLEKRITGRIVKLECRNGKIYFDVENKDQKLRLITKSFQDLIIFTYNIELKGGAIDCGSDVAKHRAVITFLETGDSEKEIVAIEFVPSYFEFSQTAENLQK
jgi:tetratricopeptide (TPR) repeat protein